MNKYPVLVCKNCMQIWNYKSNYCPYCYADASWIVELESEEKQSLSVDLLKESVAFAERNKKGD